MNTEVEKNIIKVMEKISNEDYDKETLSNLYLRLIAIGRDINKNINKVDFSLINDKDISEFFNDTYGELKLLEQNRKIFVKINLYILTHTIITPMFLSCIFSKDILDVLNKNKVRLDELGFADKTAVNDFIYEIKNNNKTVEKIKYKFRKMKTDLLPLYIFLIKNMLNYNSIMTNTVILSEVLFPKLHKLISESDIDLDKVNSNISSINKDVLFVLLGFITMFDLEDDETIKRNSMLLLVSVYLYISDYMDIVFPILYKNNKIGKIFKAINYSKNNKDYDKNINYEELYNEIYKFVLNKFETDNKQMLVKMINVSNELYDELLNNLDNDTIDDIKNKSIEYNKKSIEDITKNIRKIISNKDLDINEDDTIIDEDEL